MNISHKLFVGLQGVNLLTACITIFINASGRSTSLLTAISIFPPPGSFSKLTEWVEQVNSSGHVQVTFVASGSELRHGLVVFDRRVGPLVAVNAESVEALVLASPAYGCFHIDQIDLDCAFALQLELGPMLIASTAVGKTRARTHLIVSNVDNAQVCLDAEPPPLVDKMLCTDISREKNERFQALLKDCMSGKEMVHPAELHLRMYSGLRNFAGNYRVEHLGRYDVQFFRPMMVPSATKELHEAVMSLIVAARASSPATLCAQIYSDLNAIHPFADGNGKTAVLYCANFLAVAYRSKLNVSRLQRDWLYFASRCSARGTLKPMENLFASAI